MSPCHGSVHIFALNNSVLYKCTEFYLCDALADDYKNESFMMQFESNETVKTVNVATMQDTLFERNEIFEVTLQIQNEYQQLGIDIDAKASTLTVTIIDDDGMSVCCIFTIVTCQP